MLNIFASLLFIFSVGAFEVPALTDSVVDQARLVDQNVLPQLSNALKIIHQKGGPQVAVLTVNSIDSLTIEDAAMQVAKAWKLGSEQKDNGVLLMIAREQRKVRIEVGQGVEGDLTDAYSRRIIDQVIVPLFRNGRTSDGILLGVDDLLKRMNPPWHLEDYLQMTFESHSPVRLNWGRLLLLMAIFIFIMFLNRHSGGSGFYHGGGSFPGGWGGGFGGRGGGGGWSGGGGGFSGGGASGSW